MCVLGIESRSSGRATSALNLRARWFSAVPTVGFGAVAEKPPRQREQEGSWSYGPTLLSNRNESRCQELRISSQGRAGSTLGVTKVPANWIVYLIMIVCSIDWLCCVYLVKIKHPNGQKGIKWKAAVPLTPDPHRPHLPEGPSLRTAIPPPTATPVLALHPVSVQVKIPILQLPQEEKRGFSLCPPPCSRCQCCAIQKKNWGAKKFIE